MSNTVFTPNSPEIIESLKATFTPAEYPRVVKFLSLLYVRHKLFNKNKVIESNKHKPLSIHSKQVQSILGRDYVKKLKKLVALRLVQVTPSYCKMSFSHGYRLPASLLKVTFSKSEEYFPTSYLCIDNRLSDNLKLVNKRILSDAAELHFDCVGALEAIKNTPLEELQRNWYENFAFLAQNQDFPYKVCEQGRFHYMMTYCPRILRQFFWIRGSNLVLIDIKSSQVLLHTSLYLAPCEEKTYFEQICSAGEFWRLINSELKEPYIPLASIQ